MEIPEEMIDQLAAEVLKELEDEAKASGRKINFDDIEGSIFRIRQKIGQQVLQKTSDPLDTGKIKKTKKGNNCLIYKGCEEKKIISLL